VTGQGELERVVWSHGTLGVPVLHLRPVTGSLLERKV
jgi:hypothetical protein